MHCNQYKCVFISFNIEYRKLILKERRIHERKTDATTQVAGSVQADIALVCGTATDKVEFNKTIAKLPAPDPEPTPNPDTKLGDITFEPVVSEDVSSVNVDTDKKKLIEETLDDKQKDIVNKGGSADIVLSIKNATDNNAADKKLIEASFKANEKIGKCLDVSLLLTVKDKAGNVVNNNKKVSDSQEMITITINVPSDLISNNREYKIIRVHNGVVKTVDSVWDADNKTITFKTNEFSTYAIVYRDVAGSEVKPSDPETKPSTQETNPESKPSEDVTKPSESVTNGTESSTQVSTEAVSEAQNTEPGTSTQTGDATRLMMWLMIALLSGAGIAGIISKKKKLNN